MKTLICVPTYNERENVSALVPAILKQCPDVHILIIDDNSPDKTGELVQEMMKQCPELFLLSRPGKQGLGKAYLAGFEWGLNQNYELIVEMDADFSHRPEDLKNIITAAQKADFVIGSRYVAGGGTQNWGVLRKMISVGGSIYSRFILGFPFHDWTGGFNAWKSQVLREIKLNEVQSEGYSFQIELKYRAAQKKFNGIEVPIMFEDRRVGQSKMGLHIVIEALWRVWNLKFSVRV